MDDADQTAMMGRLAPSDLPERPWADPDFADADADAGASPDAAAGLASLSFIVAAIRRGTRFWCIAAAVGLVLGVGLYLAHPPPYKATAEVLLTLGPNEDPETAIQTEVALAESRPVAGAALRRLGLQESVSGLLASYAATPVTPRVLLITVGASSSAEAVRQANVLATSFLQFRADQLNLYQQLTSSSLNQGIAQSKARSASISSQVNALSGNATSPAQTAKLSGLQDQLKQARSTLSLLEQTGRTTQQATQTATSTAVHGSYVINAAAPIIHSRAKTGVVYAVTGLIAGVALGIGLVVVYALVSDRLRRRDDIADALSTSVRLSVGKVRPSRWRPRRRGLAAAQGTDVRRIVVHLSSVVAENPRSPAALAVVSVDNPQVAALAIASLAVTRARQGDTRIVVADLCSGAPAARLLGARNAGVRAVSVGDAHLVVAVPDRDDVMPIGPLDRAWAKAQGASSRDALVAACASADLLLTLVTLDPALGGEHLATWATDAVVMVTAGRSSWTRVQAVGEMIRLAGIRLASAVVVGADKTDESLGVTYMQRTGRDANARDKDVHPPAGGLVVTVNGASGATVNGASGATVNGASGATVNGALGVAADEGFAADEGVGVAADEGFAADEDLGVAADGSSDEAPVDDQ